MQLKHHRSNVKLFFQLVCSVQSFLILLTPWYLCWTRKKAVLLHRFLRGLDSEVNTYFHAFMHFGFSVCGLLWSGGDFFFPGFFCSWLIFLLCRCLERSVCSYHHDWYLDCATVVHLRFCEGLFQTSSSTSTWNARISEEEAWFNSVDTSWTDFAGCPVMSFMKLLYIWLCGKQTLYGVIIGCTLIPHNGLNSTTVIAWNKWETECLVSVYYCIYKLHFTAANASDTSQNEK